MLFAEFYCRPSNQYLPKHPDVHSGYKSQEKVGAVAALFQYAFEPIYFLKNSVSKSTYDRFIQVFGFVPNKDKKLAMKTFLYNHAATYQFCKEGACSWRCAYAAMKLAQIFQNTKVAVFLQSNAKKDQFVVVLGKPTVNGSEFYVYDPLLNADLLFSHQSYQKDVLPTYPDAQHPSPFAFKMKITKEMAEDYEKRWPKILKFLLDLCEQNRKSSESLCKDFQYCLSIMKAGYSQDELASTCQKAVSTFDTIVELHKLGLN